MSGYFFFLEPLRDRELLPERELLLARPVVFDLAVLLALDAVDFVFDGLAPARVAAALPAFFAASPADFAALAAPVTAAPAAERA